MALGRRSIDVQDASTWVFNRCATAYEARPPYPVALIDALAALAPSEARVCDLGAGIGHVSLPLAARNCDVTAIEPARAMLECLQRRALVQGSEVRAIAARAEALPLPAASTELVLIADALHFLDAELAGLEVARVLVPDGVLAIVTCELGDTVFMREISRIMAEAAPRRPRPIAATATQLAALCDVELGPAHGFQDATPVTAVALADILRSISFIGPAMNPERWAAFEARVHAIEQPAIWARTFQLRSGRRRTKPRPVQR